MAFVVTKIFLNSTTQTPASGRFPH